ncbi:MAG: hypothetical protein GWN53_17215 [Gammaproteobacteria bacterium]|uniref:Uncharacterized protein n=1 Tax=Candidatus Kutchimonas denitrificans TaxID=3056748 RepID=A0AAE5CD79_9BACT|nr:hypothetical protein [Candidatus Kutchimonas denitrificans]NIV53582.1 hypothetical protein [Gammaproteobacteria bacterium]
MTEDRNPWDKLPEETQRGYSYFREYLEMPATERSIHRAAEKHGKADRYWQELSAKHNWVERATAYDEWIAEQADEEMVRMARMARREMAMEATKLARRLVEVGLFETDEPNPTVVRAIVAALDRAGVSVPKDINVSGEMSLEHILMELADEDGDDQG